MSITSVKDWTPERRATAAKAVRFLRRDGYSYAHICDALEGVDGSRLEPWEVYELANPGKTAAQVNAWKDRHDPGAT